MRKFVLGCLALIIAFAADGKGCKITVRLGSAPGKHVLLAHYYGSNVYVDDTIKTDSKGVGIFQRDTLLPQGLYKIYLNQDQHFDFLLGADQGLIITNPSFALDKQEISGSRESMEFLGYLKWLKLQQLRLSGLDSALAKATEAEKENINLKIRDLTMQVSNYWKQKSAEYPGTLLSSFLMANYFEELKQEDIPAEYSLNDSLKWIYQYNYRKNHFFDYLNLSDERLLYTPLVKSKLDTYFDKVLLQMYDSVKPAAYNLIKRTEPFPKMFRFVTSHLLNSSLNSRIMGMDALFVDIARDYYLSGIANWADSTTLAKIRENVIFLENNLIGMNARDIKMETFAGQPFRLYQQNSKYTILLFWEPGCSHCKEFVPELYNEIYLPYRDKGVEVVAAYNMNNKKEWGEFIEQHHLNDWINVWDEHHLSRFKIIYDTRTTPSVYLLDKDKKIIAKKFSIEFLKSYFGQYLGDK